MKPAKNVSGNATTFALEGLGVRSLHDFSRIGDRVNRSMMNASVQHLLKGEVGKVIIDVRIDWRARDGRKKRR